MQIFRFLKWASASAFGHVVLFGTVFLVGEFLAFSLLFLIRGTLTISMVLRLIAVLAPLGIIGGLLVWFTVTLPRIRRRKRDK
jgi:hypothetical protein